MAPRRTYFKRRARRPRRWRKRGMARRNFRVSRPSLGSGIPNAVIMKHKYSDNFGAPISSTINTAIFHLNSLYDPYQTGVGHQPYYFDQLAALYNKYTVFGVKVDLVASCGGANTQCMIGMKAQRDTTALVNIGDLAERPGAKWTILNSQGPQKRLSKYFNLAQLFGVSKKAISNDGEYSAASSASPTKLYYLNISAQHPDGATATNIFYNVTLTFYSRWSERIRQTQS